MRLAACAIGLGTVFIFILAVGFLTGCTCVKPDEEDDDSSDSGPDDTVSDDAANDSFVDDDTTVIGPYDATPPPWPEWVLRHWVWEDESTQESATAYVEDYLDHDIPVGAVIIDSPWETGYNTFVFEPTAFPDAQEMVDHFHDLGVRVFLWITPNVNVDSPNYQEGLDGGYYLDHGRTLHWWKGDGSFIDYWNPDALAWWHGQMDKALDLGIDGWKCDGSDFSLYQGLFVHSYAGPQIVPEYQKAYYSDFFNYTREKLGNDRVITARPVDSYGIPWGPDFAPRDVNFAGWVGDQDPNFNGLRAALLNMFMSGNRGYVNFGSDIGGYRETDLVDGMRDKTLFIRWAQFGALSPIMENGGGGEHRPWMYDDETLTIYRDFTKLHHSLIPYLYSQGASSYGRGLSLFRPVHRDRWEYMLGDSIFVAPMTESGLTRDVNFPEGTWVDFFTGVWHVGGTVETVDVPLDRFPVYVRKGDMILLDQREGGVFDSYEGDLPPYTIAIYPDDGQHEFVVYEEKGTGALIRYDNSGPAMKIYLSATQRDYAIRISDAYLPESVHVNPTGDLTVAPDPASLAAADMGYAFDAETEMLWIKPGSAKAGLIVKIE